MRKSENKTPRFGAKLLKLFLSETEAESISGDYTEMYEDLVKSRGKLHARIWFWFQILKSLFVSFSVWLYWNAALFRNSIKILWRHIKRNKAYTLINTSGLALGMACCILILLWVQDELSWDRFHENADTLFHVMQKQFDGHLTPVTPGPLAAYLKAEYPEVENSVRWMYFYKLNLKHNGISLSESPIVADASFFEIFSFPFVKGNPETAFDELRSMVITEGLAERLFGDVDPYGKIINVNNQADLRVTGVIKNVPHNSTLQFDYVLPFQLIKPGRTESDWTNSSIYTFVRLREKSSDQDFNEKIRGIIRQHNPQDTAELRIQSLPRLHLHSQQFGGRIIYVYIFSAMAVFVLLIACFNFINLVTARSANRAREVGLRKVVGANRKNLIRMFFGESFIFTIVSLVFAILLVMLFLPAFNHLSGKQFTIIKDVTGNLNLMLGILVIVFFTGILSGSYPALLLSSFQPASVLKTIKNIHVVGRSPYLRRILVVFQFSITVFLMIGMAAIYKQMGFIRNSNLGFDKSYILCSESNWGRIDYKTLKEALGQHPDILSVTFANQRMGDWESSARDDVQWDGKKQGLQLTFEVISCDYDFLDTFRMDMLQGRFFSKDIQSDLNSSFILNETAVKAMGFNDESPLGKTLSFWDRYNGTIIGVIKDFHTQSLHEQIQPVIIRYDPTAFDNIFIRIRSDSAAEAIRFLENKWKELTRGFTFEYYFLDESLDARYKSEQTTGSLLKYFTILAVFIACIGLLGLVSFMAQQRTKEIGIRIVLGASKLNIIKILVREYVLLIVLANFIAWPLAYFFENRWMSSFAYRTSLGVITFFVVGVMTFTIALLTACSQALRIASADPVNSLHYE